MLCRVACDKTPLELCSRPSSSGYGWPRPKQ
eukprot:SAG31_NODE_24842_length_473_cov_0.986631_1_plen_30_part_01